jgi:[acyl-carrier-protein] S-malonyltransferase
MVAGHSLGEFSSLVANETLSFEDALLLVSKRAFAMQKACEIAPSTMAVVLGLEDAKIIDICNQIDDIVVPANYNAPGQLVISGTVAGIEKAIELLKKEGAKRAMPLKVGGAFHSPLMNPAKTELADAIHHTAFNKPICPVYQNATAQPSSDPEVIKNNLIEQLVSPVRWTECVRNMIQDGATSFTEFGPGEVLQGLIRKIDTTVETNGKK